MKISGNSHDLFHVFEEKITKNKHVFVVANKKSYDKKQRQVPFF